VLEAIVGGKRTTCLLNHDFIVLLRNTEWTRNKQDEINHSYKLLTAFKVVSEDVYGSLPRMGKVTNTISVSWRVNLAISRSTTVRVSSLFANCLQRNGCFSLEIRSQSHGLGRKNNRGAVTLPTPKVGEHSQQCLLGGRQHCQVRR